MFNVKSHTFLGLEQLAVDLLQQCFGQMDPHRIERRIGPVYFQTLQPTTSKELMILPRISFSFYQNAFFNSKTDNIYKLSINSCF